MEEDKKTGRLDETKLLHELTNTKEAIAGYNAQLERIQGRIKLIKREGAVIWPGASFLTTIALTVAASALADGHNLAALSLWIPSIATFTFGVYRVFITLGAIQEVTVTSKEAIERLPEAVKVALRELEEERKPELLLTFTDKQPPFSMVTESEESIKFGVSLSKGDIARKVEVAFFASPGFEFPDSTSTRPAIGLPDYATTLIEVGNVSKPLVTPRSVKLKAPSKPKTYLVFYRLYCEDSYGDFEEFKIVVKKP